MTRSAGRLLAAVLLIWTGACATLPKFREMTPDQVWEYARAQYEEENWTNVITAVDRLLTVQPSFRQGVDARLMRARAHYEKEEYITSASEYERIVRLYGSHPLAPDAALGACKSYHALSPIPQRDQTDTRRGMEACRSVAQTYPDTEAAAEARRLADELRLKLARKEYQTGEFYMERSLFDSALISYERVVEEYPDTRLAPKALLRMAEAYQEIGYEDEVTETLKRLLEEYPDSPEAEKVANAGEEVPGMSAGPVVPGGSPA